MADNTQPSAELFFALDSARIGAGTSDRLAELVDFSARNPNTKIVLDGHADSTGTEIYNIGLSSRRTDTVQAKLIAMGIPAAQIYRGIYGENGLRRTTDSQDRRVTIWVTEQSLYSLIEQSLVRGIAVVWNTSLTAAEIDAPQSSTLLAGR